MLGQRSTKLVKPQKAKTAQAAHVDWRGRRAAVYLLVLIVAVLVGAGWIIHRAHTADDFWDVALPGISTGAGTLILAAVTFWLSGRQKRLDDAARADADYDYALREARKVIPSFRNEPGGQTSIAITNAGRESIIEIHLQRAWTDGTDLLGATALARWEWSPNDLDSWISGGRTAGWYRRFVAPGESEVFEGSLQRTAGGRQRANVDTAAKDRIQVEVAWTDATGRHWLKQDWHEPIELEKPPMLRPPIGLEDVTEDDI